MFTGIVEATFTVSAFDLLKTGGARLTIQNTAYPDFHCKTGDSIAVNGCCLTVVKFHNSEIVFDLSSETIARTTFSTWQKNTPQFVNIERALTLSDRLGGHLVSGHIDGIASLLRWQTHPDNQGAELEVSIAKEQARYCVHKGSICLDGISLTIAKLHDLPDVTHISVAVIPETILRTNLGKQTLEPGMTFNLEVDMLAKFVERQSLYKTFSSMATSTT